ncbi:MAG: MCP four helix bundle domain-containing protein, partial [Smithella sp.]
MFNDIKMGTKLTGSFMVIVAILIAVAMVGYINIKSIANRGDAMYNQNTAAIEDMSAINNSLETMRGDIYRYLDVPADRQKMSQSIDDAINSVNKTMQSYKGRSNGAEEKKIIAEFDAAWPEMQR